MLQISQALIFTFLYFAHDFDAAMIFKVIGHHYYNVPLGRHVFVGIS